jgi:hypothetical protein
MTFDLGARPAAEQHQLQVARIIYIRKLRDLRRPFHCSC